jgi:molybdopterin/thiamine biosynthesis adenylyltransferase
MSTYSYETALTRNAGIISEKGQEALKNAVIAVAGCGGAGGSVAVELARMGVRTFRLADPDHMDVSNINRQEGAFMSTVGTNKTEVIARMILDINPEANVTTWPDGINEVNIEEFLKGATVGLEEIDYRKPWYTRLVHTTAEKLRLPLVTGIPVAWNAFSFVFDYSDPKAMGFDEYVGLHPDKIKEGEYKSYDIKTSAYAPELPLYLGSKVIRDVLAETIEIPCISPGVSLAAAQTAAIVYFFISKARSVKPVPYYYSAGDLYLKSPSKLGSFLHTVGDHVRRSVRRTRHVKEHTLSE